MAFWLESAVADTDFADFMNDDEMSIQLCDASPTLSPLYSLSNSIGLQLGDRLDDSLLDAKSENGESCLPTSGECNSGSTSQWPLSTFLPESDSDQGLLDSEDSPDAGTPSAPYDSADVDYSIVQVQLVYENWERTETNIAENVLTNASPNGAAGVGPRRYGRKRSVVPPDIPSYIGVRMRAPGRWTAEFKDVKLNIRRWLGTHNTPEDAARAYNQAILEIRGPHTRTNFEYGSPAPPPPPSSPPAPREKRRCASVERDTHYSSPPPPTPSSYPSPTSVLATPSPSIPSTPWTPHPKSVKRQKTAELNFDSPTDFQAQQLIFPPETQAASFELSVTDSPQSAPVPTPLPSSSQPRPHPIPHKALLTLPQLQIRPNNPQTHPLTPLPHQCVTSPCPTPSPAATAIPVGLSPINRRITSSLLSPMALSALKASTAMVGQEDSGKSPWSHFNYCRPPPTPLSKGKAAGAGSRSPPPPPLSTWGSPSSNRSDAAMNCNQETVHSKSFKQDFQPVNQSTPSLPIPSADVAENVPGGVSLEEILDQMTPGSCGFETSLGGWGELISLLKVQLGQNGISF